MRTGTGGSATRHATARLALLGTAGGAFVALTSLLVAGPLADGLRLAARSTARFSFAAFLVVYVASPLVRLASGPTTRWLMRERRGLGLAFAAAQGVHLLILVMLFQTTDEPIPRLTAALGGLGFAIVAAMAATSSDAAVRRLGPWWPRLHSAGLHYLWVVFTLTHALRVANQPDDPTQAALLGAGVAALAIRIAARPSKPRPPARRSTSRVRPVRLPSSTEKRGRRIA